MPTEGIVVRTKALLAYATIEDVIAAAGEGDAGGCADHVTDEATLVPSCALPRSWAQRVWSANARRHGWPGRLQDLSRRGVAPPIAQVPNLARAIDQLKEAVWSVRRNRARGAGRGTRLSTAGLPSSWARRGGISRLVLDHCDFGARLPQRGRVESLNVAQQPRSCATSGFAA